MGRAALPLPDVWPRPPFDRGPDRVNLRRSATATTLPVYLQQRKCLQTAAPSVSGSAGPRPAAADDAPVAFIRALGEQAVLVIRSDMQLAEKASYFHRVIHRDFDLTGISRFVLGSYWRVASPAERR